MAKVNSFSRPIYFLGLEKKINDILTICFFLISTRHLYRVSLRGNETGMTAKNVAIVWAPNLLRSKSIETGGVAALQGVGVQGEYWTHLFFGGRWTK